MGRGHLIVLLASAGCADLAGIGDPAPLMVDAPEPPCEFGGLDLCLYARPQEPLAIDADIAVNTDRDCSLVIYAPPSTSVCAIYAQSITVTASVTASGSRVLVLAATESIRVEGTIDVSSYRGGRIGAAANDASCAEAPQGMGSVAGAGGSFGGKGGNGGNGSAGAGLIAANAVESPERARGGCSSLNTFNRVNSGGAVWLAAGQSIDVAAAGRLLANGAGGGGGAGFFGGTLGGGSGGMVRIAAPRVSIGGVVTANGGGGAEGSEPNMTGASGSDGTASATPAPGGAGSSAAGGNGGNGGAGAAVDGGSGANHNSAVASSGGGGGGGGVGFVQVLSADVQSAGAVISPSATTSAAP